MKEYYQDYDQAEENDTFISINEHQTNKLQILGEANPIYRKRSDKNEIDYDIPVSLKILPALNKTQITNYIPFRLSRKYQEDVSNPWRRQQNNEQQQKYHRLCKQEQKSTSNSIQVYYRESELVYKKYDNTKYNRYRDTLHFAGLFLTRELITKRLKDSENIENSEKSSPMADKIIKKKQTKIKTQPNLDNFWHGTPKDSRTYSNQVNTSLVTPTPDTLIFNSNFQTGNLFAAYRMNKYDYDLVLSNDLNSLGSTQWFYFSVQGIEANTDYTFNIINFTKRDSLFNYGMKPVLFSKLQNCGIHPNQFIEDVHKTAGWGRFGKNVSYYRGQVQRQNSNKYYYVLTFTINWKLSHDTLYLAHSYPYTHTRILNHMKNIITQRSTDGAKYIPTLSSQQGIKRQYRKLTHHNRVLLKNGIHFETIKYGQSLANNDLLAYLFSIKNQPQKKPPQQAIIIMARQHPGQTQSSFVCEGIIEKFVENNCSKQVYLIPMVNPDGVEFGNYRTNLSGKDLNRKWNTQQSITSGSSLTPEVIAVKQFLTNLTQHRNITIRFILDLHGHSRKLNSFFYGNPCPQSPQSVRIFPYICSRFSEAVQYLDCTFTTQKHKKKAARIHLSTMFKQLHIYTFESSFYGYRDRQGTIIEFTPMEYMKLGKVLVKGLYIFMVKDKQKTMKLNENKNNQLQSQNNPQVVFYNNSIDLYKKFETQLRERQQLLKLGDDNSSGSESKPEDGQLNNEEILNESEQQHEQNQKTGTATTNPIPKKQSKEKVSSKCLKFIRVNSLKQTHNSVDERQRLNKQFRNLRSKKLATISQVDAVPGKYLISLLPIQRITSRSDISCSVECQTQIIQNYVFESYTWEEIQERSNLVGIYLTRNTSKKLDTNSSENRAMQNFHTPKLTQNNHKPTKINQQKKHSQIIAEIEKYRHFRQSVQKQIINRRKLSQAINLQIKQQKACKRQISIQTILTFNNKITKQHKISNSITYVFGKVSIPTEQNISCQSLMRTQCNDLALLRSNNNNDLNADTEKDTEPKLDPLHKQILSNKPSMKRSFVHGYSNSSMENFQERCQEKKMPKENSAKYKH